jgi:hypothetical protein
MVRRRGEQSPCLRVQVRKKKSELWMMHDSGTGRTCIVAYLTYKKEGKLMCVWVFCWAPQREGEAPTMWSSGARVSHKWTERWETGRTRTRDARPDVQTQCRFGCKAADIFEERTPAWSL